VKFINVLFFILILVVGFVLALLNSAPVKVNYYYGLLEMPLSFVILASLIAGVLLGILVRFWGNLKLRHKCSKLNREAKRANQQANQLKTTLPAHTNG